VSKIPVVAISREVGLELRDKLGAGEVTAKIDLGAARQTIDSSNLIATRPASGSGIIVVGSHLDTVPAGPGANDNGSGSASNLELARVFASSNTGSELRFIWFGAEENGLIGSRKYVESLPKEERDRIRGMINLDMVGVGDKLLAGGTASLKQAAQAAAKDLNVTLGDLGNTAAGGSDHASFLDAGIPALFLYRPDDPNYHAPTDKTEFVKPELLESAGLIAEMMIHTVDTQTRS
jgi:aminopeptidase YwaD